MILRLDKLEKSFYQGTNQLSILRSLDLSMAPGEVVAVIGESGSGKSTLLSLLAGFEQPDAGLIEIEGRPATNWSQDEWAQFRKQRMGFVFQNYYLIPYLTALENVALPLRLLGRDNVEAEAERLLQSLGLGGRLHHFPSQLSGGECQRVSMARALIHSPALVLADEPTGSLDEKTGTLVLDLLFKLLKERRQSALVVTHSGDVAKRCDRIVQMREGRLWHLPA